MAYPGIKEATLATPLSIILWFDSPLDSTVPVPLESFTVCFGQYAVSTLVYSSNVMVTLGLDSALSPWDECFVTYTPPVDLSRCLRGPIPPGANDIVKKVNAVRPFSRFPVKNTLTPDETSDGSRPKSNLGQTIGGYGFPYQNRSGRGTSQPSSPRSASPDDFVTAYGLKEAIQLTNIDDASATSVNEAKLRLAIEDANSLIDSYIEQSGKAGMVLISSNRRRTALIIARYYLDTVRRREDVYKDYEAALKQLSAEMKMTAIRAGNGNSAIDTKRGILRARAIPQRYNSVSGKGLSGWTTDTAGDQSPDFNVGYGSVGQRNDQPNWISGRDFEELTGGTPVLWEPTDGGGSDIGGDTNGWDR